MDHGDGLDLLGLASNPIDLTTDDVTDCVLSNDACTHTVKSERSPVKVVHGDTYRYLKSLVLPLTLLWYKN